MWEEYSGYGVGNYVGILHPYPGVNLYVRTSGNVTDVGGTGNADYHGVWNPVFYDLFCKA